MLEGQAATQLSASSSANFVLLKSNLIWVLPSSSMTMSSACNAPFAVASAHLGSPAQVSQ